MTESMIERVARVLAGKHWDEAPLYRDHYKTLARASIKAMREPTEEMNEAGSGFIQSESAWEAMIDAALKETA